MSNSSNEPGSMDQLRESIHRLEQRLAAVERQLGEVQHSSRNAIPLAKINAEPAKHQEPVNPGMAGRAQRVSRLHTIADQNADAPSFQPPVPVIAAPSAGEESIPRSRNLEAMIGLNWTSWIGAVVMVLGVFFFLKYAWDQGWIRPTPAARIMAAIVLGIAISAAGEWMHRRRMKALAGTLHGAGVAIVMAGFFGAYMLFPPGQRVLDGTGAFIGVAITAAAGIFITLHINAMTPAIISLLGAYLAPAILNTGQDKSVELLSYIAILAAVGWGLSFLRPGWPTLRIFVWVCTFLWYFIWWFAVGENGRHPNLALAAASFYYAGFLAEIFLAAQRVDGNPSIERFNSRAVSAQVLEKSLASLSLVNTAAIFAAFYLIFEHSSVMVIGSLAIGLAGLQALIGLSTPSRALMVSSWLQSAALVTLAAPLMLDKFAVTLAWLALGVAVGAMGWLFKGKSARRWAMVLMLLAIFRLWTIDIVDPALRPPLLSIGGFVISRWTMMAWSTAALAHLVTWMRLPATRFRSFVEQEASLEITNPAAQTVEEKLQDHRKDRILDYVSTTMLPALRGTDNAGRFMAIVGTLLFLTAAFRQAEGSLLTFLSLLWLLPMIALAPYASRLAYLRHGTVLAAVISWKWLFADGLQPLLKTWREISPTSGLPILNWVALNGLLLCGVVWGLAVQKRRQSDRSPLEEINPDKPAGLGATGFDVMPFAIWMGVLLFAMLNFEACRAVDWLTAQQGGRAGSQGILKQVVLSVLWAMTGFGCVLVGFRRRLARLRYAALGLLGVTLVKILLFDMAQVKAIWRILSFLAVGGLLLGVSYLYHRQIEQTKEEGRGG